MPRAHVIHTHLPHYPPAGAPRGEESFGAGAPERAAACYNRAPTSAGRARGRGEFLRDVPTETPPPYFPQNPLSPGDEKTAKKLRLTFYGCAALSVLAALAVIVGLVYLIRSLL
jgi:hypothetical protein